MLVFIKDNLGTIIVTLLLIVMVAAIINKLIQDRKKGISSCGHNCGSCAMAGACRKLREDIKKLSSNKV